LLGPVEPVDYGFETSAILAQLLRALRVVPDIGIFEFEADLLKLFFLFGVVKDTPSALRCAGGGRRCAA